MEYVGTQIDTETLGRLLTNWDGIKDKLVASIDADYGIFDGTSFKANPSLAVSSCGQMFISWRRRIGTAQMGTNSNHTIRSFVTKTGSISR
jgi:hypothetical protein